MKYIITLKNGERIAYHKDQVEGETKNPIGLWIWSLKQYNPMVLSFGTHNILATEIAMIEKAGE